MKILIAPTSFKGTLSAADAARAMAEGARRAVPGAEIVVLPLSDGGPGLIEALAAGDGALERVRVSGPLGGTARARILRLAGAAVVESADACGLHLVAPDRLDPMRATTRGVGELLRVAARTEAERVVLGLGGSATVDGGAGMAQALGWRLLDAGGAPVPPGGAGLLRLERIEAPAAPAPLPPVTALADVRTRLTGPAGAAAVFGPQKGADADGVRALERGLERLAGVVERDLGVDVRGVEGGGAAGGLGAASVAFCGASLEGGSGWVLERTGFDAALEGADVVVTGEGAYDPQTALGKVVGEVVGRARSRGIGVLLAAGRVESEPPAGVHAVDGAGARLTAESLAARVAHGLRTVLGC